MKFPSSLFLLLLFNWIIGFPCQLLQAGELAWDFDENTGEWEAAKGIWQVKDGVYHQKQRWGEAIHSLVGETSWTNYTLQAQVRIHEGNWAGVVFRAQDEFQYYVYLFCPKEKVSELWLHKAGGPFSRQAIDEHIDAINVGLDRRVWLNFQVQVENSHISLFINGQLQAEFIDETYKSGKIGVWAWDTIASFDNVRVFGSSIQPSTSVDYRWKLPITWGRLKQIYKNH